LSFVNFSNFRSANSLEIPFETREPEDFTTAVVSHSAVLEFGAVFKGARILNNDTIASCAVRLHSARGRIRIIPPSAELTISEWFSDIFVTPNAVSGSGSIELDVVRIEDARQRARQ